MATAFAVHDQDGFGLSEDPAMVQVYKDFFVYVSLTLPYSVIRGEKFRLQILVFNYKTETLDVDVTLKDGEGFSIGDTTVGDFTATVQVKANDAVSVEPLIVPSKIGQIELLVRAQTSNSGDAVKRILLVEPECVLETYSKALLIGLSNSNTQIMEFQAEFPENVVPESQYVTLTAVGDVMGPSINGLERLIQKPYGCGEQNMVTFVPNIYALDYLVAVGREDVKIRSTALRYMIDGYQRELTFQREDHSFSAFGDSDAAGSTWLSAFVVKSFRQAKTYIYINEDILSKTLDWIMQTFDGDTRTFSEPPMGRVVHTDMQGGTGKGSHSQLTQSWLSWKTSNSGCHNGKQISILDCSIWRNT